MRHIYLRKDYFMKNNIKAIYKAMKDPYRHVKWIYDYFKQDVPYVSDAPTLIEYNLPDDIEEQIKNESDKIDKRFSFLFFFLYVVGFTVVMNLFMNSADYNGAIGKAFFSTLGSYGWMSYIGFVLFSNFFSDIIEDTKKRTSLYKSYARYKDALYAYTYWVETAKLDYWMSLDGHQFENAVASVYRSNGYNAKVSKHGGDGGVDIVLEKDGRRIAVQCKAHKAQIGPSVARDLYGTMAHFGFSEGIIVSRSGFTAGVYDFVVGKPIFLKTLNDMLRMQKSATPAKIPKQFYVKQTPAEISTPAGYVPNTPKPSTVNPSFIQNMQYKNNSLFLTFKTGYTYCYYNVPESVYKEMLAAPSKGRFYNERIKDQYPYN